MRKLIVLTFVHLCFVTLTYAQTKSDEVDVLFGPEHKESAIKFEKIVGYDDTGFYMTKSKAFGLNNNLNLVHFDMQMRETKSSDFSRYHGDKLMRKEFILQVKDNLYLFSSNINTKDHINTLYAQRIDKKTLHLDTNAKKVAEIKNIENPLMNRGTFGYDISEDDQNILIFYDAPWSRDEEAKSGFYVYDKNLELIWERESARPYDTMSFSRKEIIIDAKGNVHVLGYVFEENLGDKNPNDIDTKLVLLSYQDNGANTEEFIVSDHEDLSNLKIVMDPTNKFVICAGFYTSSESDLIKGTYIAKIDLEEKIRIFEEQAKFSLDFIVTNYSEKAVRKISKREANGDEIGLKNYTLDDVVVKDDGSVVLIAERYFNEGGNPTSRTYESHSPSIGTTTVKTSSVTSTTYFYGDILVIEISSTGETLWAEKIGKNQENSDWLYSSYAIFTVDEKLFFIFNDNPENLNYHGDGEPERFKASKDGLVVLLEIDETGKQSRRALYSNRDTDVYLIPIKCAEISDENFILYGKKKKSNKFHKFSKLTFK